MIINPSPGFVAFNIEAWPHEPGGNGEHWSSGCLPAAEVATELRRLADRIESDWADPAFTRPTTTQEAAK